MFASKTQAAKKYRNVLALHSFQSECHLIFPDDNITYLPDGDIISQMSCCPADSTIYNITINNHQYPVGDLSRTFMIPTPILLALPSKPMTIVMIAVVHSYLPANRRSSDSGHRVALHNYTIDRDIEPRQRASLLLMNTTPTVTQLFYSDTLSSTFDA